MTQTPATPEEEDSTPDEVLKWRDLQNAQMLSLADIWDNPEDERWNDLPLSADEADAPSAPATTPRFANLGEYAGWLRTQPPTGRTTEEIDQYIREERDSWE